MRTTLDIDDPILRELKRLQQSEGKPLGRLVSDLLAQSLAAQRVWRPASAPFRWISQAMGRRIDPRVKDAGRDALDERTTDGSWSPASRRC